MDLWQWVLTLVGAVALAFLGSHLGRRSEHSKWLRERRYETALKLAQAGRKTMESLSTGSKSFLSSEMIERIIELQTEIYILGPRTLALKSDRIARSMNAYMKDPEDKGAKRAVAKALLDFSDEARRVIGTNARVPALFARFSRRQVNQEAPSRSGAKT